MSDFFISYNNADLKWAEWIAWQLESVGYTVVIQAWDFMPGSNFVLEMQKATAQSERTIAILSPDYLASRFTAPEWAAAFAKDPTGDQGLLLPIRVRECALEGLLPAIIYFDLVGMKSASTAKAALIRAVSGKRIKPSMEPEFPSLFDYTPASIQPVYPGSDETKTSDDSIEIRSDLPQAVHWYTGRWEFITQSVSFFGVEICPPNFLVTSGICDLYIPLSGIGGYGLIMGETFIDLDGYIAKYKLAELLEQVRCGHDGSLYFKLRNHIRQRHQWNNVAPPQHLVNALSETRIGPEVQEWKFQVKGHGPLELYAEREDHVGNVLRLKQISTLKKQ